MAAKASSRITRWIESWERTLAYDLAAYEGHWWLLVEEEALDRVSEQSWTLAGGRAFHLGSDVGSCGMVDDRLVITVDADERQVMRFTPHDAAPLDHLQRQIERGTYCTLIRVDDRADGVASQDR